MARNASFPDINLSPQYLPYHPLNLRRTHLIGRMPIYCAKAGNSSGCEGGDPSAVCVLLVPKCFCVTLWPRYELAHSVGMVDETCTNYEAIDGDCTPINVCRNCRHSDGKCFPVDKYVPPLKFKPISGVKLMAPTGTQCTRWPSLVRSLALSK
jgi:hypothetical protein